MLCFTVFTLKVSESAGKNALLTSYNEIYTVRGAFTTYQEVWRMSLFSGQANWDVADSQAGEIV